MKVLRVCNKSEKGVDTEGPGSKITPDKPCELAGFYFKETELVEKPSPTDEKEPVSYENNAKSGAFRGGDSLSLGTTSFSFFGNGQRRG